MMMMTITKTNLANPLSSVCCLVTLHIKLIQWSSTRPLIEHTYDIHNLQLHVVQLLLLCGYVMLI